MYWFNKRLWYFYTFSVCLADCREIYYYLFSVKVVAVNGMVTRANTNIVFMWLGGDK